jgi:hypothetical protein
VRQRRRAGRRLEAALRARVELGDVPLEAQPRGGVLGIDGHDPHGGCGEQALDVAHGRDRAAPAGGA